MEDWIESDVSIFPGGSPIVRVGGALRFIASAIPCPPKHANITEHTMRRVGAKTKNSSEAKSNVANAPIVRSAHRGPGRITQLISVMKVKNMAMRVGSFN